MTLSTGRIKYVHPEKDFGFITVKGEKDVFFRLDRLDIPEGFDVETVGTGVGFSTAPDPKREGELLASKVVFQDVEGPDQIKALLTRYVQKVLASRIPKDYDLGKVYYGSVIFVNDDKGFGFIRIASGDKVFFHASKLVVSLNESDKIGTGVRFKMAKDEKKGGWCAIDVEIIDESGEGKILASLKKIVVKRREYARQSAERSEEYQSKRASKEQGSSDVSPAYAQSMRARQIHRLFNGKDKKREATTG